MGGACVRQLVAGRRPLCSGERRRPPVPSFPPVHRVALTPYRLLMATSQSRMIDTLISAAATVRMTSNWRSSGPVTVGLSRVWKRNSEMTRPACKSSRLGPGRACVV
jgi:hypothetical protein